MGGFERFLSLWVLAAILVGLALGQVFPGLFAALAAVEYASVNLIVAVLIWAMVYPNDDRRGPSPASAASAASPRA